MATSLKPDANGSEERRDETFSRLVPRTVTADAVDQIKQLIATGVLTPGEKLPSERALADLLGVSRPTTREVVRALEALGVIESRHGSGTYVTDLSGALLARPLRFVLDINQDALGDIFAVRVMLEAGAAQAACGRIDAQGLAQLQHHVETMATASDADSLLAPDLAFHRLIHEASGNGLLLALMDGLRELTRVSLQQSANSTAARHEAVAEHLTILDALRDQDGAAAAQAMQRHVESAYQRALAAQAVLDTEERE